VGSVFSPYYAAARKTGVSNPLDHCAINVCLYLPWRKLWAMTERTQAAVERTQSTFRAASSSMEWEGDTLVVRLEETANPLPFPIRGTVRLRPGALATASFILDRKGRHRWWPAAPFAHVEAAFEKPEFTWSGDGYFDMNYGEEPLEDGFRFWSWSRAALRDGAAVLYDVEPRGTAPTSLALRFSRTGDVLPVTPPERTALRPTLWVMKRETRSDGGARIRRTLEDTPFYARSVLDTTVFGARVQAMHEALSLDRFRMRWVQKLLPYRMPRSDRG
jgi:carotenoid 1,2-hydratase